jgi:hypothetical protein
MTAPRPEPRGELSAAVLDLLCDKGTTLPDPHGADPWGEDLTLALHLCYELHYQGLTGVAPRWEWDPSLLAWRAGLESAFEEALRAETGGHDDVPAALAPLLVERVPGAGVTHFLRDRGDWWQVRELLVHRSIYHHKEADPHAWVIPRLRGVAKAAVVAVEYDEFGGGRAEAMHSRLFADMLEAAGLNPGYLHYLDQVPAPAIAVVNLMSMLGLHRALRGALVGHFAAAEITTAPAAARMVTAIERHRTGDRLTRFYTEHIEADAVHEQVLRHDVIDGLLADEPRLASDVVFGVAATGILEDRLADHLLRSWRADHTSLRGPLAEPAGSG